MLHVHRLPSGCGFLAFYGGDRQTDGAHFKVGGDRHR
jgi:hypothetical protein